MREGKSNDDDSRGSFCTGSSSYFMDLNSVGRVRKSPSYNNIKESLLSLKAFYFLFELHFLKKEKPVGNQRQATLVSATYIEVSSPPMVENPFPSAFNFLISSFCSMRCFNYPSKKSFLLLLK